MASDKNRKMANDIAEMFNSFGIDYKGVANEMLKEHRTLQQSVTRFCKEWMITLAKAEPWQVDGRNEASCDLAKKVAPICEDANLPFV